MNCFEMLETLFNALVPYNVLFEFITVALGLFRERWKIFEKSLKGSILYTQK